MYPWVFLQLNSIQKPVAKAGNAKFITVTNKIGHKCEIGVGMLLLLDLLCSPFQIASIGFVLPGGNISTSLLFKKNEFGYGNVTLQEWR